MKIQTTKIPNCFIDLHLHLDGAITPAIAKRLARLQNQILPAETDEKLAQLLSIPRQCEDLNEYLKRFDLPISLLQTKESICEAVFLVCEQLRRENVLYAELRFAPQSFTERGLSQRDVIEAALKGLERTSFCGNLILCCMRGSGREKANEETVQLAKEYLVEHGGVVALDLAGAEGVFPTSDYKRLFAVASQLNVPFTLHAGEADGAESVRCAIEMGASRIGHGVRSFEDKALIDLLRYKKIPLELCPTSNRQTHAVSDMKKYPLADFIRENLCITINTDNPAISNTTIAEEFNYARKLGVSLEQEILMLFNAVDAAFTDEKTKQQLKSNLQKKLTALG